jgi:hypothetical protein
MKNLLSFDEFVNEKYNIQEASDADAFDAAKGNVIDPTNGPVKVSSTKNNDPGFISDQDVDKIAGKVSTMEDLTPGKEYVLTVGGKTMTDMLYQGVADGIHIFNGEDKAHDMTFTDTEMSDLISKGGVSEVDE